jgi:transcriptional regulator with XRE-family HTH domain
MKELREKLGLSQADVARKLNISRQSYNFYENCKRDPDTETLKTIAAFFNVSIDYLLGHDDPIQKEKSLSRDRERLLEKISSADEETAKELEQFLNYLESKKNVKKEHSATTSA